MTGQPCPALHILRGAMGDGVQPTCTYRTPGAPCIHCHATKRTR